VNILNKAWEIKEEQSISVIKVTTRDEEEYVVLSLKDEKNELKPSDEH
jgi:hypothetical protein